MTLSTLKELVEFLQKNCYNLEQYGINQSPQNDGFSIEKWGELFVWSYTERGKKENIKYFSNEKSAVDFTLEQIQNDKLASSHLISITKSEVDREKLEGQLKAQMIQFWTDEIPTLAGTATRFFVIGCDINKVNGFGFF